MFIISSKLITEFHHYGETQFNPLNAELNPICHLLALLGVHHFLHVSRIRVKRGQSKTVLFLRTVDVPLPFKCVSAYVCVCTYARARA